MNSQTKLRALDRVWIALFYWLEERHDHLATPYLTVTPHGFDARSANAADRQGDAPPRGAMRPIIFADHPERNSKPYLEKRLSNARELLANAIP